MLGTLGFGLPSVAEAKTSTAAAAADPQIRVQIGSNNRYRRGRRSYTTTRITRVGPYRYRETLRVTYLPNGRTRTRVINRVRLGRNW
jgi:hypothetical protein